jgi:hypothetical protein
MRWRQRWATEIIIAEPRQSQPGLEPRRTAAMILSHQKEKDMSRLITAAALSCLFAAPSAHAVVYCKSAGVPKGCVVRPAAGVGVGAPGPGVVDPGINQPGAAGNVGVARPVARPGVGAPGPGVVDPGINQPGAAGNVGAANLGGPVNRAGRR